MIMTERRPLACRVVAEAASALIGSEVLLKAEIRLKVPKRVLVDSTTTRAVERKHRIDEVADVSCELLFALERRWAGRLVVIGLATRNCTRRGAWNRDPSVGRLEEDRPRGSFDTLAEVGGEPIVPTPPERRLVGHSLEPEATAERGSVFQIRAECRFVVPPVEFLEQKPTE